MIYKHLSLESKPCKIEVCDKINSFKCGDNEFSFSKHKDLEVTKFFQSINKKFKFSEFLQARYPRLDIFFIWDLLGC